MAKKFPRLLWATIVSPTEYDVDKQMRSLVQISNSTKECWVITDAGKTIGLYLDWRRLRAEVTHLRRELAIEQLNRLKYQLIGS